MADFLKMENVQCGNDQNEVLSQFNLGMKKDEINVLLGAPGNGKSTVLRSIAGLEKITKGKIVLEGNHISTDEYMMPIHKRHCTYIAKNNLLFPHLTVKQNIQLPLRGRSSTDRKAIVANVLAQVDLAGYERYPAKLLNREEELRVAIARALVLRPSLMLINNPFACTVASQQLKFIGDLRSILTRNGITALIAMEDHTDAFAIADKIGIMHQGKLLQWDTPYNIYHHPQHRQSVQFIGEGVLIKGHIQPGNTLSSELGTLSFDSKSKEIKIGKRVEFLVYPDDLSYHKKSISKGTIIRKEFQGAMTNYTLRLSEGSTVQCLCPSHEDFQLGKSFAFKINMDHLMVFMEDSDIAIDLGAAHLN